MGSVVEKRVKERRLWETPSRDLGDETLLLVRKIRKE